MQFLTGFTLLFTTMVTVTGAAPVSTDADAVANLTPGSAIDGTPNCDETDDARAVRDVCMAMNTNPHCRGATFINSLGGICKPCTCSFA